MPDAHDPLNSPLPAVLKFLNERMRTGPDGTVWFADDAGHPILDTHRPGCPNADARAVAMWSRSNKPDLWREASALPEITRDETVSTPHAPETIGGLMAAAKGGDQMALRRLGVVMAQRLGLPGPSSSPALTDLMRRFASDSASAGPQHGPETVTALMLRARAGDATALAALQSSMKPPARW